MIPYLVFFVYYKQNSIYIIFLLKGSKKNGKSNPRLQEEITEKVRKGDFSHPEVILIGESEL